MAFPPWPDEIDVEAHALADDADGNSAEADVKAADGPADVGADAQAAARAARATYKAKRSSRLSVSTTSLNVPPGPGTPCLPIEHLALPGASIAIEDAGSDLGSLSDSDDGSVAASRPPSWGASSSSSISMIGDTEPGPSGEEPPASGDEPLPPAAASVEDGSASQPRSEFLQRIFFTLSVSELHFPRHRIPDSMP
ncbi:uncharacterized protein AMSG_11657 [Thecamonas trahens ATCC 50062]|uniref:Uncharacterized protein n=1 Tax=Thecamonas trahens ATCC 50062 TaxID=461836 RepID=A0A0L0DQY8_THETB|nr:hypothetical protein AMSG_11657 [Thecamonas trahens ATCC 50062]KNC54697.1 hypothetical protein AMSG_11657 [Thecamonas trahens ATCC 50062]|eukprot:XP_013761767.1 hypothetical protein AMSG_11657 [Thecamonas trahens ATCC 50062]